MKLSVLKSASVKRFLVVVSSTIAFVVGDDAADDIIISGFSFFLLHGVFSASIPPNAADDEEQDEEENGDDDDDNDEPERKKRFPRVRSVTGSRDHEIVGAGSRLESAAVGRNANDRVASTGGERGQRYELGSGDLAGRGEEEMWVGERESALSITGGPKQLFFA